MFKKIKVPASSANLGPGFDSIGVALNLKLDLTINKQNKYWYVNHNLGKNIPHNQNNLIVQTALKLKPDLLPHKIKVQSNIPLTAGLGSSSSALIAGIELANQLGEMHLSKKEVLKKAVNLEGHPDNVSPAVLGDLVIASYKKEFFYFIQSHFPDISFIAYIPNFQVYTQKSRKLLPKDLSFKQAVRAGSIGNTLTAALLTHNLKIAGKLIEKDLYHEPYRKKLSPSLSKIRRLGHQHKAIASYLSGAGPTIITLIPFSKTHNFIQILKKERLPGHIIPLRVDKEGLTLK